MRQRLVAILVADAAGYSRFMSLDDRATVHALDMAREIFRDRIVANDGRVVDMAGDSILAIFDTAIGALKSALEVQKRLATAGVVVARDEPMRFRIGVHLGDVIEKDDGTIYGDGVNIAARLEGLAEPGGIAVSQSVEASINHRLNVRFVDMGAQQVKNIAQPVRAFRCEAADLADISSHQRKPDGATRIDHRPRWLPAPWLTLLVAVVAVATLSLGLWAVPRMRSTEAPPAPYSSGDRRMTFAVLPFVSPVDDETGKKVATAMGEAVMSYQERNTNWAQVVPRAMVQESSKAHSAVPELGRVLATHFLLRGVVSVDPPGYKVDVAVVDTNADRVLATKSILIPPGALLPKRKYELNNAISQLTFLALGAEVERARSRPLEALDVRDLTFRAYGDWGRAGDEPKEAKAAYDAASKLLNRALALAPDDSLTLYATAFINLCTCVASWSKDIQEQQAIGTAAMEKFLRLHPENPTMLLAKSELYRLHGRFEESLLVADSVLRRDPEQRAALLLKTSALMRLGRAEEALATSDRQMQLVDEDARVLALAAAIRYRIKNYPDAAVLAQRAMTLMDREALADPISGTVALTLIAAEGQMKHRERAAAAWRDFTKTVPTATSIHSIKEWMHPSASLSRDEPLYEGLRLAGVTD